MSSGFSNQRTRTIEGAYDNYRYDSDGKLIAVPSGKTIEEYGTEIDSSLRIPKYHVVEQDGYIWVWTGKDKPQGDPLEITGVGDYIWTQQTMAINADPNLCLQLEMDWPSSYAQDRLKWAHRRAILPFQKSITLDQPYEARSTEHGFELFQPPTKAATDAKIRQSCSSVFSLPDRVVHQKFLKRAFWKGFGDFMSVAHFVPVVDPITGVVTTRAEYMWTPLVLPGYAFQRNKITTYPNILSSIILSDRQQDKNTLETLQSNINHWNAVDRLGVHPSFVDITITGPGEEGAPNASASSSNTISTSRALATGARPAFGPETTIDSPANAVANILQLAVDGQWNTENGKIIIPDGRHLGTFRVTHADS
jgi:hypothetical protein